MRILDIPKSGRCGDFVFYMLGSKLCRRRYVVPKDPRTAGQLRVRAAFGAASKEWSHSRRLTEEQREAWRRKAKKVRSHPRLGQSGPLTGQQDYVGWKCAKKQIGGAENAECRTQKAEATSQGVQARGIGQSTWETRRGCAEDAPCRGRRAEGFARKGEGKKACLQVCQRQRVARPTWEWWESAPRVIREQSERGTGGECKRQSAKCRMWNGGEVRGRRNGHWRELWHGS